MLAGWYESLCCLRECPPPKSLVLSFEHGSRQGKDARREYIHRRNFVHLLKNELFTHKALGALVYADDVVCMVNIDDRRVTETCDNGSSAQLCIMKAT